jgi:hypothetical protein
MNDEVRLTGELPAGPYPFRAARGHSTGRLDTAVYRFDQVTARGVEFCLDEVRVYMSGGEFDRCLFRQDARLTKANRSAYAYSYGVGHLGFERRSRYRNCTFDHVDFGSRGGGCVPWDARFEGCTFRHCAFRRFDARSADFVDCAFVGTITSATFHRNGRSFDGTPRQNLFSGNDLSRARPRRVEFRNVDLTGTRLPDGPEYLRIDDFLAKARQARATVAGWPEGERDGAEFLLRSYEKRASEPLFCWRGALADRGSGLWSLLESL